MTKPRITLPNTEYDRGFENGALAARDVIVDYLDKHFPDSPEIHQRVLTAWENDTLVDRASPAVAARPLPDLPEVP